MSAAQPRSDPQPVAAKIRVLLIEPDAGDCARIRSLLERVDDGVAVELDWVPEPDRGRAALFAQAHDVCLLDYMLGERTGIDLLRAARAAGADMPVILLTAQDDHAVDLQATSAGAAFYLAKSGLDARVLERTIRYALELHRATARGRENEMRLRAVIDHAFHAIITVDEHGAIESYNPAAERLFGYAPHEVIGRDLSLLIADAHGALRDVRGTPVHAVGGAQRSEASREVLGRRKDGTTVPIDFAVSGMRTGGMRKFIASMRDVSDRLQMEALLRTRARLHEALGQFGNRALVCSTVEGVLDAAVRVAAETLGAQLAGVTELQPDGTLRLSAGIGWWSSAVGADQIDVRDTLAEAVLAGEQPVIIPDLRCDRPLQHSAVLMEHGARSAVGVLIRGQGQSLGILSAYGDTPRAFGADEVQFLDALATLLGQMILRHRAEAALRDSERRLQLSVDAANIGLWDWDLANDTVYYSRQWKAQLGYAEDEIENRTDLWATLLHPEDRERAVGKLWSSIKTSTGPYEDEFRLRHRDGSYRWVATRAALYRDAAGRVQRMVGAHVDITPRREVEEALRRFNAELEARVVERTAQLAAANRELEAFSYSVSHDLRAPLRAIDGFASALAEECGDELPPEARHYLERVRAGAMRMGHLIDDLLRLARVTRSELRDQPVDLSALARDVAGELRQKAPDRAVEFEIAPDLEVRGDPILLRQMMENLLDNAWKYTSKHARARIEFGVRDGSGGRVYFVRDDGAGFDSTYADKLFGPFQRLHGPGEFEGTGIGLATVQRIIQRHGGRVWAEGAVEGGATISFTL